MLRRYEGTTMFSFAPLIYAINARNIAITTRAGDGATPTIDGDGEKWQQWMLQGETKREKAGRIASYKYAKQLNNDNLPLDKRIFINPEEDFFRPGLIEFYLCERVKVEGVKLTNSPFWVIHPIFSKNLVFRNLFYDCQVVNNDGIDPESCHNVLIENIIFNNHDDNVAIKSGRDREAREGLAVMGLITDSLNTGFLKDGMLKGRSENIVIRNSVFKGHHAICIGSEIAGGAKNIYAFDNIAPQEVYIGIFLKSSRKRGGTIENVFVENFKMNECKVAAITLNPNYDGDPESKFPPSLKNVYIQDVTVNKAKKGISLWGWPDSITKNIFLKNININQTVDERFEYNHIEGVILTNVKVKGQIFDGQYKKSEVKSLPPRQD